MPGPMKTKVLVVGGGPGGYVAAIRAGQLGLDTVLVEADKLGGTCLIRGCIPSKALIHAADDYAALLEKVGTGKMGISISAPPKLDLAATTAWKETVVGKLNTGVKALLKKAHVKVVEGFARFTDAKTCEVETAQGVQTIVAENVILATGSVPVELPFLPFGGDVISSTEALSLTELPKKLVVVGAGYIGLELGIAFRKLGSEVTVVEALPNILPLYDAELIAPVQAWLKEHGVTGYEVNDLGTGLRMLQAGRVDFWLGSEVSARFVIRAMQGPVPRALYSYGQLELHMACHLGTPAPIVERLNAGLEQMRRDGELAAFGVR